MSEKPAIGHAAFYPYAGTPEPLRSAGNLPVENIQTIEARVAELERENANHAEVRKQCAELLSQIRDEVQKHEDEPAPKGFSWVRFCEFGDRMSCLLRGIKID